MKKNLLKVSLILLLISSPSLVSNMFASMGGGGGHSTPCGGPYPPCPIPLDGGVSVLLLAGAAYGGKKIYNLSKKKNPS